MLKLSHIKKGYKKKEVLTDVDYTFQEGNIYPYTWRCREQEEQHYLSVYVEIYPVDDGSYSYNMTKC